MNTEQGMNILHCYAVVVIFSVFAVDVDPPRLFQDPFHLQFILERDDIDFFRP